MLPTAFILVNKPDTAPSLWSIWKSQGIDRQQTKGKDHKDGGKYLKISNQFDEETMRLYFWGHWRMAHSSV